MAQFLSTRKLSQQGVAYFADASNYHFQNRKTSQRGVAFFADQSNYYFQNRKFTARVGDWGTFGEVILGGRRGELLMNIRGRR